MKYQQTIKKIIYTFCFGIILFSASSALAATRTWDGGGATNNWSEAANWSGDTVPVAADVASFDNTSSKDVTIDVDVTVTSVIIFSLYPGTITQGSSNLTTTGNFTQSGGTFTGGSGNIVVNGSFSLNNANFTASSNTTTVSSDFSFTGTSVFNTNGGTVVFTGIFNTTFNVNPNGTLEFNNVEINKSSDAAGVFVAGSDTLRVTGNLNLTNGRIIGAGGLFEALGAVTIANTFDGGDGQFILSGNATRTVTIPAPLSMPRLTVNAPNTTINTSGTGTISFPGQVQIQNVSSITNGGADFSFASLVTQTGGIFNVGSGAITFSSSFTQSGGTFTGSSSTLDFQNSLTVNGGTFTASSSNTIIANGFSVQNAIFQPNGGTVIFTGIFNTNFNVLPDGVLALNNVEVNKSSDAAGLAIGSNDTMQVNGTFTLTNGRIIGAAGGTPEARGNLTIASTFDGGDGRMAFGGANVQTFQNNGGILPTGTWTVNKNGGTVNLLSDLDISGGTSSFTLTDGTITTGANTVITGTRNITNTNGFIIGGLRRSFPSTGSRFYAVGTANGFAPVTIQATAGTFDATTAFTVRGNNGTLTGASPTQSLTRNWTLEPSAGGITTANLTFQYLETDLPIGADESNFDFLRRNGGMTTNEGIFNRNTTTNIFSLFGVTQFSDWTLGTLAPTAANVIVGGRVLTDTGRGISGASLSLIDSNGNVRITMTNPFGHYRFNNVEAAETYVISVSHKSFQFANPTQVINVSDSLTNIDFTAENQISSKTMTEVIGQIKDSENIPLTDLEVEISGGNLKTSRVIRTDKNGVFIFEDIKIGETFIINVYGRKYIFPTKVLFVGETPETLIITPIE